MRLSGTLSRTISTSRGLGDQLWDLAGNRPSLDLPFADNKSLVDATTGQNLVSFTRASSGTYVDSQGVIRTATTNLLLRSEEFGTTWGTLNSSVSADATIAPNGTSTADKIIEHSTTSVHGVNRTLAPESLVNGIVYTFSVYAKAAERGFIWMQALNSFAKSYFNLSTGVISSSGSGHTSTITAVGNGWYRCAITFTSDQTNNSYRAIGIAQTSGTESYAGDGSSGLFLWGAQLEQSSTVGEYIPTTSTINSAPRFNHNPTTGESLGLLVEEQRTNLLLRSEEFDNASWTKTGLLAFGSGSTANATTAPNGTTTADLLTESTAANAERNCYQSGFTTAPGTLSCYIKPNGRNFAGLRFYAASNNWVRATFTLTGSGAASAVTAGSSSDFTATSASITSVGNGWYRVSLTASRSTGNVFAVIDFATSASPTLAATSGNEFYTGDGTSGLYLWGAQLEAGAFPTSYIPTTTATVTRSADVASISGSNFSAWYRQDAGSVFVSSSLLANVNTYEASFTDNTNNNHHFLRYVATQHQVNSSAGGVANTNIFADGGGSVLAARTAYAYGSGAYTVSTNGTRGAFSSTTGGVPSTVDRLNIGFSQVSGATGNLTIRRFTFWPTSLSGTALQAVTQ